MRTRVKRAVSIGFLIAASAGGGACLSPPGKACGDEWCPEGYFCTQVSEQQSVCVAPEVCGNGIKEAGEQCDDLNNDDGDGCEANCSLPFCGNGIVDIGEECDDRNTTGFDGCSSTCRLEPSEMEPNEDGTPSTGGFDTGNDFSTVSANGPFTDSVLIRAAIAPAGDEDVFKFTNQRASPVKMTFDTWSGAFGINVPCGNDFDTVLHIYDATEKLLIDGDDRATYDLCSTVTIPVAAGETVYVHVMERSDGHEISGYILMARYAF